MRAITSLLAAAVILFPFNSYADTVEVLVRSLKTSSNYKVRVTAATLLSRYRGDRRALAALLRALHKDRHPTVRGTAAFSLGKLGDSSVIPDLEKIAKSRKEDRYVRKMAKRALKMLKSGCPAVDLKGKRLYIHIGKFKVSGGHYYDKVKPAALRTFRKNLANLTMRVPYMTAYWPKCKAPRKRDLRRKKIKGFMVDGIIVIKQAPGEVRCKVKAIVATFPGKSIKMSTSASAAVGGSLTPDSVSTCVEAIAPVIFQGVRQYLVTQL